jgi:hypothetical protein
MLSNMSAENRAGALPDSLLDPTLAHIERVERSLSMASRALHLELASIILDGSDKDPQKADTISAIGKAALRIATLADDIAKSTADDIVGFDQVVDKPAPEQVEPVSSVESTPSTTLPSKDPETVKHIPQVDTQSTIENIKQEVAPDLEENKLYNTTVSIEKTPVMVVPEGVDPLIGYVDKNGIKINGKRIQLEGDKLFLFNSLMLQRNGIISNDELRGLGFNGDTQAFHSALTSLIAQLNKAAEEQGIEIIKKIGQRKDVGYAVNPVLQLVEELSVSSDEPEIVKKN